ncbi:hypothetical protein WJX72_002825 [[Myrmecia] bisecta]|uniref:Uncharacterized protein n=1 Tax=[Myrmecia] bisecta TaxID=41462 RepID=A0AAW1Q5R7_9CHLO
MDAEVLQERIAAELCPDIRGYGTSKHPAGLAQRTNSGYAPKPVASAAGAKCRHSRILAELQSACPPV